MNKVDIFPKKENVFFWTKTFEELGALLET